MVMGLALNWLAAGAAGAHHRLLRLGLHHVAEAADAAEHRHRRRCRRLPAGGGLGRGDRRCVAAADDDVRDHLLLDAAAFLGPGALPHRRLRPRRRADAAGRRRPAHTLHHILAYTVVLVSSPSAAAFGLRGRSTASSRWAWVPCSLARRAAMAARTATCWRCGPSATRSCTCLRFLPAWPWIARSRVCAGLSGGDERGRSAAAPAGEEFGRGAGVGELGGPVLPDHTGEDGCATVDP